MLINMVLKNRLGENPSRSEKDKFVKNFKSMLKTFLLEISSALVVLLFFNVPGTR